MPIRNGGPAARAGSSWVMRLGAGGTAVDEPASGRRGGRAAAQEADRNASHALDWCGGSSTEVPGTRGAGEEGSPVGHEITAAKNRATEIVCAYSLAA